MNLPEELKYVETDTHIILLADNSDPGGMFFKLWATVTISDWKLEWTWEVFA